jgi:hypothetical protein
MPSYPTGLSWLPDWRDPTQYPTEKGTSGTKWAWEFLRRNPEYQEASRRINRTFMREVVESLGDFLRHDKEAREEFESEIDSLWLICEKFHLTAGVMPPDPSENNASRISFEFSWMTYYMLSNMSLHPTETIELNSPDKILFQLDLTIPVEPQIEGVRRILSGVSRYSNKFHVGKLGEYLRILDAKTDLEKPSYSEIAREIYPKEVEKGCSMRDHPARSKIKKNHESALDVRDNHFWKLPAFLSD